MADRVQYFPTLSISVEVSAPNVSLTQTIAERCASMQDLSPNDLRTHPAIAATRNIYKRFGKDPSRYRPSAEALGRRALQGKGLYSVSNVVDVVNLVSLESGFSIGSWDERFIEGAPRLWRSEETDYEAIGRGTLNIEGLPGVRDDLGTFGTPTSDSMRTRVRDDSSRILCLIYCFSGDALLIRQSDAARLRLQRLLEEEAKGRDAALGELAGFDAASVGR